VTRSVKTAGRVGQRSCLSPILLNVKIEYATKEYHEVFVNVKIGQVMGTVKYADALVLLAKGETVPRDVIDRLVENGKCNRMEINIKKKKSKIMRISG
jgi:retron-type reverse transcriptase